jgi:hypothetical protein
VNEWLGWFDPLRDVSREGSCLANEVFTVWGRKKKLETPLTSMSRSACAVHAETEILVVACDALPATIQMTAHALRGRGPGDACAAVSWSRCGELHRASARRTRRFLMWDLRPGCPEFQSGFGAGVEPATDRLGICCSTRLSYPEVGVPDSNRRPAALPLLYRTELTPSRNTFSRHRAYATATPRAPDGPVIQNRNPYRWIPFDRCFALPAVANRQFMCASFLCYSMPPPASSIATQHRCASWRNPVTARPMRGPQCPDVRCRMLRKIMFGASTCRKTPARYRSRRESSRAFQRLSLRMPKKKNPRMGIRGHSRSSEIGATDLQ